MYKTLKRTIALLICIMLILPNTVMAETPEPLKDFSVSVPDNPSAIKWKESYGNKIGSINLTVGDTITLKASAINENNIDVSEKASWGIADVDENREQPIELSTNSGEICTVKANKAGAASLVVLPYSNTTGEWYTPITITVTDPNAKPPVEYIKGFKVKATFPDGTTATVGQYDEREFKKSVAGKTINLEIIPDNKDAIAADVKWVMNFHENPEDCWFLDAKPNGLKCSVAVKEYYGSFMIHAKVFNDKGEYNIIGIDITSTNPSNTTKTKYPKLKGIKIEASPSLSVVAGKKVLLTATRIPVDSKYQDIYFTSSNEKYATVNKYTGQVKTKAAGAGKTVTITATAQKDKKIKKTVKIKILKGGVKSVKLKGKKSVKAGKKIKLKAKVKADPGANTKLKFKSSNKKYATVNKKGVVKTKPAGKGKTVTITATSTDGTKKKAKIKIKIK